MSTEVHHAIALDKRADSRIILEGDLGLKDARRLREDLLRSLETNDAVHLDMQNLSKADVSIIQLLISAHKYAGQRNRTLKFSVPANSPLLEILNETGIVSEDGSAEFYNFWLGADKESWDIGK